MHELEQIDTVVIGAGQSGLSVGYHLARHGVPFVILEGHDRVGDSWRRRWDSLRLFTPAKYDGLDGMRFPGPQRSFPTKDQMADYLEAYARRFALPVQTGVRVDRLSIRDGRYVVELGARTIEANHVVVAMASYQTPDVPRFASDLSSTVVQMHSSAYRNPGQLREGGVLVVGAATSGADIALEAANAGHPTWLSGRHPGHVPFRIESWLAYHVFEPLVLRVVFHHLLNLGTPLGRRVKARVTSRGGPLLRVKPRDLAAAGVNRLPRTIGVRDGKPLLENGKTIDVTNVIWSTGYTPGFSWIDLPIFGPHGEPIHDRGVVGGAPGLYFVGLHFLYALSSTMIHGMARDARYVADAIARSSRTSRVRETERRERKVRQLTA